MMRARVLRPTVVVLATLAIALGAGSVMLHAHEPHVCPPDVPDEPVVPRHLSQEAIVAGQVTLAQLLEAGERLFAGVLNTCDGQGRPGATGAGTPTLRVLGTAPEFLRTSAPDASSCAGCHNQPHIGGGGDFVANVFVLAQIRNPVTFAITPDVANERNTLGMNGAGAIELLAREMTADLHAIRADAVLHAVRRNTTAARYLRTKGISFGRIVALPNGTVDPSGVEGIDADLVVRPFHQSGGVVSLREFSVNAMNHHHGMQAVDRFGAARTGVADFDGDGVADELTVGDITALTIFQAALNVPGRLISRRSEPAVADGERLFRSAGCIVCHVPFLVLDNPVFCEPNPLNPPGTFSNTAQSFCFDLTREGPLPRLERRRDGKAVVRAFTDLKRHRICDDQDPYFCNERLLLPGGRRSTAEFLTRKLWDVGNGAPYGHRGDLTTITEAILAHGAEGRRARDAFAALSLTDRSRIIQFLKSLQVLPPGSDSTVYVD